MLLASMALTVICKLLFSNNFNAIGNLNRFLDINDNQLPFGILFQINLVLLAGTLLVTYLSRDYDYIFYTPLYKIFAVMTIMLLFFFVRYVIGELTQYAFGVTVDRNYNLKVTNYYTVYGVLVLWIGVLLFYFSDFKQSVIAILVGVILIALRMIQFYYRFKNREGAQSKFWYYNILYLCALEILPTLVLFKILTVW